MKLEHTKAAQTTHCAMGTVMTHKAFGPQAEDALAAVCQEIAWLESLLSRFLPESDISRINASAGIESEKVSPETYAVLAKGLEFSQCSPGYFDMTIAPLVTLWSRGRESNTEPDERSIRELLPLVNARDLILDPRKISAGLRNAGQSIDLGGIGKGFAGDRMLEVFRNYGVTSAFSNLGGNVVTLGAKPDGSAWQVGIQHPRQENRLIGSVGVMSQSVVTSGDYQRFFTDSRGKMHHHILDPKSGYPSDSGLISVSIVAENSLAVDALSTIVFVAGMAKGLEILRSFPGTEGILVDSDLRVSITRGLRYRFQAEQGIDVTILG
jgi:FAD:protein FMN transferase